MDYVKRLRNTSTIPLTVLVQASPAVADGDETRTIGNICKRSFIAPFRVTCLVTEQKSADVIVAKCRE